MLDCLVSSLPIRDHGHLWHLWCLEIAWISSLPLVILSSANWSIASDPEATEEEHVTQAVSVMPVPPTDWLPVSIAVEVLGLTQVPYAGTFLLGS